MGSSVAGLVWSARIDLLFQEREGVGFEFLQVWGPVPGRSPPSSTWHVKTPASPVLTSADWSENGVKVLKYFAKLMNDGLGSENRYVTPKLVVLFVFLSFFKCYGA